MAVIRKISDERTLLEIACELLNADMAILFKKEDNGPVPTTELHAAFPTVHQTALWEHLDTLRSWYKDVYISSGIDGYVKNDSINVMDKSYPDALVAFSNMDPDIHSPRYELLLCMKQENTERYTSYDCWAAAQMVRQFEYIDLLNQKVMKEQRLEEYASSLSVEVFDINDNDFEALNRKLKKRNPKIVWKYLTEWYAYQTRKKVTHRKKIPEWLEKPSPLHEFVIDFLTDDHSIISLNRFDTIQKNLLCAPCPTEFSSEKNHWHQLKALVLENAWNQIYQIFSDDSGEKRYEDNKISWFEKSNLHSETVETDFNSLTQKLIHLTRGFVIERLISGNMSKSSQDGSSCLPGELRPLNRETLRLYFVVELANPSNRLAQLYLGVLQLDERRSAPPELCHLFIRNLSRYMLSIIQIIQGQLKLHTGSWPVSPLETLDSLLYLVDRFVHIELDVEESLNIRLHLGRQISSEVQLHLNRPHYRDHLLHVIDVFLFGYLLLNTHIYWRGSQVRSLLSHFVDLLSHPDETSSIPPTYRKDLLKNWAVASLFHDIGYQLGHGDNVSHHPKKWLSYFELPPSTRIEWLQLCEQTSGTLTDWSMEPFFSFLETFGEKIVDTLKICSYFPKLDHHTKRDHGVLSAIRILQLLLHAENRDEQSIKNRKDKLLTKHYEPAIHAIAYHNLFSQPVSLSTHPLSCLLRICDEVQEWDRRRVNIEKVIKQLYLDIQYTVPNEGIYGSCMVESCFANIEFKNENDKDLPESIKVCVRDTDSSLLNFVLMYRDSKEGNFDPTMTMLGKAYNFQHIDLSIGDQGQKDLAVGIVMNFPVPREYGRLTEYDIYGLFTEEVRTLPLLREFGSIHVAESGLIRIKNNTQQSPPADCFGIRIARQSNPNNRHGWLSINPELYFEKYIKFKDEVLSQNRLRKS